MRVQVDDALDGAHAGHARDATGVVVQRGQVARLEDRAGAVDDGQNRAVGIHPEGLLQHVETLAGWHGLRQDRRVGDAQLQPPDG